MLRKETQYLPRGVWTLRISIAGTCLPSGPGVTCAVDLPLLCHRAAVGVATGGHTVVSTARHGVAPCSATKVPHSGQSLRQGCGAIARMHCGVSLALKDDRRKGGLVRRGFGSAAHCGEG